MKKEVFFSDDLRNSELIMENDAVEQFAFRADRVTELDAENQYSHKEQLTNKSA